MQLIFTILNSIRIMVIGLGCIPGECKGKLAIWVKDRVLYIEVYITCISEYGLCWLSSADPCRLEMRTFILIEGFIHSRDKKRAVSITRTPWKEDRNKKIGKKCVVGLVCTPTELSPLSPCLGRLQTHRGVEWIHGYRLVVVEVAGPGHRVS